MFYQFTYSVVLHYCTVCICVAALLVRIKIHIGAKKLTAELAKDRCGPQVPKSRPPIVTFERVIQRRNRSLNEILTFVQSISHNVSIIVRMQVVVLLFLTIDLS